MIETLRSLHIDKLNDVGFAQAVTRGCLDTAMPWASHIECLRELTLESIVKKHPETLCNEQEHFQLLSGGFPRLPEEPFVAELNIFGVGLLLQAYVYGCTTDKCNQLPEQRIYLPPDMQRIRMWKK